MGITCFNPNNNFSRVWAKKYVQPNFEIFGVKMLKVFDGTICFEMLPNYRKTIFKIDTLGNVVWNRYYEFPKLISFNEVIMLNDSEIVVSAHHKWDGIPETPHSCNPLLLKFDLNGGIKQMKVFKYDSYCAFENLLLHNKNIYASGSLDSNWIYYSAIAKFDSNLEPIWQYKSNIDWDYYADILTVSNNGNLFMGSQNSFSSIDTNGIGMCDYSILNDLPDSLNYHEFYDDAIIAEDIFPILKDTLLNIIEMPLNVTNLCINTDIVENNLKVSQKYIIYPNPTKGKIFVNATNIENIEIYNVSGKKMDFVIITQSDKTAELDLTNFSNGLYITKITSRTGTILERFIYMEN